MKITTTINDIALNGVCGGLIAVGGLVGKVLKIDSTLDKLVAAHIPGAKAAEHAADNVGIILVGKATWNELDNHKMKP